ncbi:MAG: hypothetical protein ACTSR8_13260 [Promethearchaeota archaeon]
MTISSLRPINIQIENISGMTANVPFDSNLVIIYGYNREGKTILIKCFNYVFNGFRPGNRVDLNHILVDGTSGNITLIFTFKGILYKLTREITKKKEHVTFQRSNVSFKRYKELPKAKQKLVFDGKDGIDIIPRTEVKSKGTSIDILSDELKKIKLHPEIIDRLIAIENIQEFKNATEKFGTTGGGYEAIKDILHKDLKDKSDAIEHINAYLSKTMGKLESQKGKINNDYKGFIENLKSVCQYSDGTLEYDNLIKKLKLEANYEDILKEIKLTLKKDQENYEKYKQTLHKLQNNISTKKEKYEELENLLLSMNLEEVEEIVESYYGDVKLIQDLFSKVSQIHREIETNPPGNEIEDISIDFSKYFNAETKELVEGFDLDYGEDMKNVLKIPKKIKEYVLKFNEGISLYSERKRILSKYSIEEDDVSDAIKSREAQLERIKNPIAFEQDDEIFNLYGKIGIDSTGSKVLMLYMSLSELRDYIDNNNPLNIDQNLLPVLTEDDNEEMADGIVKELSKKIEDSILELQELEDKLSKIQEIEPILIQHIKSFEEDLKIINRITENVNSWNKLILEQKTMSKKFIDKHLKKKTTETSFEKIKQLLEKIESEFKKELTNEGSEIDFKMMKTKSLLESIKDYKVYIEEEIKNNDEFLDIVSNFNEYLSENQEIYKKLCKDLELNENLKNIIIPTIQVICAQIKSNIQLDEIEEQVMNKIIKYAEHFYKEITKERFLKFEKFVDRSGKIFLKPKIITSDGRAIDIADDMPSGSEQGAIALGIMVALAKLFNGLIVIDEVTDRFDYDSKQRFFDSIKNFSEDLFWIIVLKVDTSKEKIAEEFQEIRDTFADALILQPIRRNLKIQVNKLEKFEDWTIKEG